MLEEQRQKRAQRKLAAKISNILACQDVEPGMFQSERRLYRAISNTLLDFEICGMFPGEKEMIDKIRIAIEKGDGSRFDEEIQKLSGILDAYRDEYHLEVQDVLNNRLGSDCITLLHKAAGTRKRSDLVW